MSYRTEKQCEGVYVVIDEDDEDQVARVSKFNPGPMVSVSTSSLLSPPLAKAVARAMTKLANDLEKE